MRVGAGIALAALLAACGQVMAPSSMQIASPTAPSIAPSDDFTGRRLRLVQDLVDGWGISDPDVVRAVQTVPRHEFVPAEYLDQAYDNHPLPIGYGQTISQPYIVAWMTELLNLQSGEKVLEIGTGSGYQAAILAELGTVEVYSIEIVPQLAESSAKRLKELGYSQVHTRQGDGYYGWPEYAPFDAIIVTAAPDHVPAPLAGQLKEGGRMVIPIGPPGGYQSLWKFVNEGGKLRAENLGGVAFVPLTGAGIQAEAGQATPTP